MEKSKRETSKEVPEKVDKLINYILDHLKNEKHKIKDFEYLESFTNQHFFKVKVNNSYFKIVFNLYEDYLDFWLDYYPSGYENNVDEKLGIFSLVTPVIRWNKGNTEEIDTFSKSLCNFLYLSKYFQRF